MIRRKRKARQAIGREAIEAPGPDRSADHIALVTENARLREQLDSEISKRHQVEQALRRRTVELEERESELDAFAHTVAHDLKTPISAQVLLSSMLETNLSHMQQEQVLARLARITQAGFEMTAIIDSLLILSSVRTEEAHPVPIDMADILPDALRRVSHLMPEHEPEIEVADEWPLALGHVPWVEEIWVNYLSNAIKHGKKAGTDVAQRIEVGFDRPDDSVIQFRVADNGPGIDPQHQQVLFAPLERIGRARAQGSGLGLSIVRRMAEKLGGSAGVESELGRGSTFYFTLPSADRPRT